MAKDSTGRVIGEKMRWSGRLAKGETSQLHDLLQMSDHLQPSCSDPGVVAAIVTFIPSV
jgi:hypothetical protein